VTVPRTSERGRRVGHELPGAVRRGPPIGITCTCGSEQSVAYGERWTCDRCSVTWDTAQIPREDYDAIRWTALRYRLLPVILGLLVGTLALLFMLTGNAAAAFVLLGLAVMIWFTYLRAAHRRRLRAALANGRNWALDPA
jgi:Flp pilus assembly protein TadB